MSHEPDGRTRREPAAPFENHAAWDAAIAAAVDVCLETAGGWGANTCALRIRALAIDPRRMQASLDDIRARRRRETP